MNMTFVLIVDILAGNRKLLANELSIGLLLDAGDKYYDDIKILSTVLIVLSNVTIHDAAIDFIRENPEHLSRILKYLDHPHYIIKDRVSTIIQNLCSDGTYTIKTIYTEDELNERIRREGGTKKLIDFVKEQEKKKETPIIMETFKINDWTAKPNTSPNSKPAVEKTIVKVASQQTQPSTTSYNNAKQDAESEEGVKAATIKASMALLHLSKNEKNLKQIEKHGAVQNIVKLIPDVRLDELVRR